MSTSITWHGHANFQIACDGVSVLVDPFFTHNPACKSTWEAAPKADLVLVTHDHGDHVGDAVALCTKHKAVCGCVVGTAEKLIAAGLAVELVPAGIGFNIGGSIEVKGIRATMTEAFHSTESGVNVGYIITMPNGFRVYHAGDTGIFASMELLGSLYPLDLALLPIGGLFTMDGFQAAHAARLLKAKAVIPMHWNTFPVLAQNTSDFAAHLSEQAPECRLLAMAPGDTITV